jgi:hypothetical protein
MGELYLAGTVAPAGLYRLVGTNINIFLKEDDYLPASLDGRVACYELIRFTWQQLQQNIDGRSNTASRTSE